MHSLFRVRHSDALLWICLGAIGTYFAFNVPQRLLAVREATHVTKEEKQDKIVSQRTEDAVRLDTLGELLRSPSFEIRQAAIKIIVERASRPQHYNLLLENLKSRNPTLQAEALTSLRFLAITPSVSLLRSTPTLDALITYLVSTIPATYRRSHKYGSQEYLKRPQSERDALVILARTINFETSAALSVGLITSWLKHYPFGGLEASQEEKQHAVSELNLKFHDDHAMRLIINLLLTDHDGQKAMYEAGLVKEPPTSQELSDGRTIIHQPRLVNGELVGFEDLTLPPLVVSGDLGNLSGAADVGPGSGIAQIVDVTDELINVPTRPRDEHTDQARQEGYERAIRSGAETSIAAVNDVQRNADLRGAAARLRALGNVTEESREEIELRRRRRMAMVISDGGGPLGRDDIYEGRRNSGDDQHE